MATGEELSDTFQSPSHRGGSAPIYPLFYRYEVRRFVSIPFSSGRERSPKPAEAIHTRSSSVFQSPSHRGGSAPVAECDRDGVPFRVSIPFSSGRERSLPQRDLGERCGSNVSIPFSSGRERSEFGRALVERGWNILFQSPSHRGGSAPFLSMVKVARPTTAVSIPFSSGRERSPSQN